jgi:ADP-ribosylglycohydrolase
VYDVVDVGDLLPAELAQQRESGHDVAALDAEVSRALAGDADPARLRELYEAVLAAPMLPDWPYREPSTWPEIEALLPAEGGARAAPAARGRPAAADPGWRKRPAPAASAPATPGQATPDRAAPGRAAPGQAAVFDKVYGGWLGRCAGCTLGKPVEGYGWTRDRIRAYLEQAGAYPLRDYIPALEHTPPGTRLHPACWRETTRGNVAGMARDDDIDYTIIALHVLENHGFGFGPADVGAAWLELLPYAQTFTAERAAYRNLVCGRVPPATATVGNPYREWIGAQIRGDLWGYVCPGDPRAAARLAFADASLSHTANGIYGEMWVAALVAVAATTTDAVAAVRGSLEHVPPESRLSEALRFVLDLHDEGLDADAARDRIEARFGHYSWLHTVNNAAVVAMALLWGDGDFSRTVGLAVECGWDTDCNGATAGSVSGITHGARALPRHWVDPLQDRVRSAVSGYDGARISDLVDRTVRLAAARTARTAARTGE